MNLNYIKRIIISTIGMVIPSDFFAKRFPVSIKGIIIINNDKVILLKNERNEWDLPGGKLDANENIDECLKREIKEELNLNSKVLFHVKNFIYPVQNKIDVFVAIYLCEIIGDISSLKISFEHKEVGFFSIDELSNMNISTEIKNSIIKIGTQI